MKQTGYVYDDWANEKIFSLITGQISYMLVCYLTQNS